LAKKYTDQDFMRDLDELRQLRRRNREAKP